MNIDFAMVFGITITGLVVVFIALILLIICMYVMGKIVYGLQNRKNRPKKNPPQKKASQTKDQQNNHSIVAAITAAISHYVGENHPFAIREIKPIGARSSAISEWRMAGLQQNTRPFEGDNR